MVGVVGETIKKMKSTWFDSFEERLNNKKYLRSEKDWKAKVIFCKEKDEWWFFKNLTVIDGYIKYDAIRFDLIKNVKINLFHLIQFRRVNKISLEQTVNFNYF